MSITKTFEVRWADVDPNLHMKSISFFEYATHTRFAFLESEGVGISYFNKQGIGPILFDERVTFFKELRVQQSFTVNTLLVYQSDSGHKWHMTHEFKNEKGKVCAIVSVKGAWFSIADRKIQPPPSEVTEAFKKLEKGEKVPDVEL